MTVDANPQGAPRRSRLLYPALLVSLALNLLFIGGLSAAAWHYYQRSANGENFGLLGFAKQISPDHRDAFRQQVLAARASLKDEREDMRRAWFATNEQLTSEPFDKEKFKAAMATLRDAEGKFRAGLNNAFADIAASVTPEERKLLQAWRNKRKPHFLRHGDAPPADSAEKPE